MKKKIIIAVLTVLVLLSSVGIAASAASTPAPHDAAQSTQFKTAQLYLTDLVYIRYSVEYKGVDLEADEYGVIFWMAEQEAENYTYEAASKIIADQKENDPAVVMIIDGRSAENYTNDKDEVIGKIYQSKGLIAKKWADLIYARSYVKNGDEYIYSDVLPYSVTAYAARMIRNDSVSASFKAMLTQMMEYGASAQENYNYHTENLATEVLPENHKNHVYREKVSKEATCTENGEKVQECIFCKDVKDCEVLPATGHQPGKLMVDDPTCTEPGVAYRVCENCGEHLAVENVTAPATGHKYGDWIVDKDATCTEKGTRHRVCSVCGDIEKGEIAAKGHTPKTGEDIWAIMPATCTEHSYAYVPCTVCGGVAKKGETLPGGELKEHDWNEWEVTTEPTCTKEGEKTRTCKNCSAKETEKMKTVDHSWGEWVIDKEATCTEAGSRHRICSKCEKEETETIKETGHKEGEWQIQKATCTEDGYAYMACKKCGENIRTQTLPGEKATGHKWGEWTVTKEATCTEAGEKTRSCTHEGCKETQTEVIPATNHKLGDWIVDKEANCSEEGLRHRECACGEKHEEEVIPVSGKHTPAEGWHTKEATCTECAYAYQICTKCHKEINKTKLSDKLDHEYKDGECVKCHGKEPSKGLAYALSSDGTSYILVGLGTCKDVNIVIPETYEGKPVTAIADLAFVWCSDLKSITIPESVTSIGEQAFHGCKSLTSVEFGGTAEEWSKIAVDTGLDKDIPVTCKKETAA